MRTIGSRELKAKLSEVLRNVREHDEVYIVTQRGRPIARLVPETASSGASDELEAIWAEMDELAKKIGQKWPKDVSAAQAVSEDRREL